MARVLPLPKYRQAAALVRAQITDGVLVPGAPAPSGAALSRMTGYSVLTCRRALSTLIADGILVPGASRAARPRVPAADPGDRALGDARRALARALARHRRDAGLTQPQLAGLIGVSVTNVGHAETGRLWQSRSFWEQADDILNAGGGLLRLHNAYRAADAAPPGPAPPEPAPEVGMAPPATAPAESPAVVTVDPSSPVTCITVTWADGSATTVHPPGPRHPAATP